MILTQAVFNFGKISATSCFGRNFASRIGMDDAFSKEC